MVLEVNTWVWLDERSSASGRRLDLGTVPAQDWDDLLLPGLAAVWLMGVWTRSPAGSVIARSEPGVRAELDEALADLVDEDIVGSPYSVRGYTVDARLGGNAGLAAARQALAERGARLILDYVPNHVARDHAWVTAHPEYLVRGTPADAEQQPTDFITVGGQVIALGRDPYFPPWTDVVQLNAFAQPLRDATVDTLNHIATMADGVRCDMAMLLLNDVFARTWGDRVGPAPARDFWEPVIAQVKANAPSFLFVAEAYWDLEPQLLEQGFDYCYDKRLYDRLITGDAGGLREHLRAPLSEQRRAMRFLENHDEPRSASLLPDQARRAAAVAVCTLPGALLLYEGQAEGRTARPPVQLGRRPAETLDHALRRFYDQLLAALAQTGLRSGTWTLLEVEPADAAGGLVAWSWEGRQGRHLVVVNLSDCRCEGRVRLAWSPAGEQLVVAELLSEARYHHDAADVAQAGLYVLLDGHAWHLFRVEE